MTITAKEVNELRKQTNAGMMDCKKALIQAEGDFEKAIEILRKKGQKISASRADRATTEGRVFSKTNADKTLGISFILGCETDFVAKNDQFVAMGEAIMELALQHTPVDLESLKSLPFKESTVQEEIVELMGTTGEKLELSNYNLLNAESVVAYTHTGSKLGVLVGLKGDTSDKAQEAGRDVAMQIAAMNPLALDKANVDEAIVAKELEIAKDQAKSSGKPEAIIEKIAQGKVEKYFKENTLLNQPFVKDNNVSVQGYLHSIVANLTVSDFKRVKIG